MRKLILLMFFALPLVAVAQKENADIRAGNAAWGKGDYKNAEIAYRNALQINGESVAALSNLASALHKQSQDSVAVALWQKIAENKELSLGELSAANYNAATSMLKGRQADPSKLDAAIEGFKQSLRQNPNDRDAKYNLAYAQKLKQDGGGGGGGDDKDKDQNQDQKNDQQNQDQQQDKQDQNKDDQDKKDQQQDQQQAEKPESRADAERMADAIQRAEDRTKEKVDKEKKEKATVGVGGKSW